MIKLDTHLSKVHGIGPRFLSKLKKLGIETVRNLVFHTPTRYEDYSHCTNISELKPKEEFTISGIVKKIVVRRAWTKRKMTVIEGIISDETGSIRVVWFNQPYIKNILTEGKRANFSGKVSLSKKGEIYLSNPTYEIISEFTKETKHTARVVPIYHQTKGLTSKGIRYLVKPLLQNIESPENIIPQEILEKEGLMPIEEALEKVHFPETIDEGEIARKRFVFEEFFLLELFLLKKRGDLKKKETRKINVDIERIKKLLKSLPFDLTESQKKSLWEITKDLEKDSPMNRLLLGDVGSGKTIIASISAILATESEHQVAFMAPTEILARQHYKTLIKFFPEFESGIGLLTGSDARAYYGSSLETETKKKDMLEKIKNGEVKIIVGTHTLVAKKRKTGFSSVVFNSLGLVIIDEQHRFGVRQRAHLLEGDVIPHFLSMSATPIPRTLSLTLWSDLDLSVIDELPKDRKPIITRVVEPAKRKKAYEFIRNEIKKGRQAFVVCPRIKTPDTESEDDPALEIKAAEEEFKKLSNEIFPEFKVALLHGKIKTEEKEKIMSGFLENYIHILVATSVIEVGIDVPNATIMMVEGSDRFGLAQLYQFRGRVGRGEHQSYCLLFTDTTSQKTEERLLSIVKAKNGRELAEADLKLRGPGEFIGEVQSGNPDLAMDILQNPNLAKDAKKYAEEILEKYPDLQKHPKLKERVERFTEHLHEE